MKNYVINSLLCTVLALSSCQAQQETTTQPMKSKYNELTEQQKKVILEKGTDRPFTGDYYLKNDKGVYICRQCNNPLYSSGDKFEAHCGWPSFDDAIPGAVKQVPDADGERVEIICNNCQGHLGHVFAGEGFTDKNTRYCVNTSSIVFYPSSEVKNLPSVIK
ncbi:MAG: methionine-R-sulfoxide reductase [Bacteroidota bacterium]